MIVPKSSVEATVKIPVPALAIVPLSVTVDGKFELRKKDFTLKFRGSSNQRIIDVPKTLKYKNIVL